MTQPDASSLVAALTAVVPPMNCQMFDNGTDWTVVASYGLGMDMTHLATAAAVYGATVLTLSAQVT